MSALELTNASEEATERAIAVLKSAIDAAENGNQAGENFVVAAARDPELLKALNRAASLIRKAERVTNWSSGADPFSGSVADEFEALIAKAAGAA